ncbi:hypothetical protein L3X07_11915 [Levilactobacillus brevis]|nr:hypothetical protein [Levilactobacillus brevis]
MDFLGLRNLSILANALALVKKQTGKIVDLNQIDLNDPATLKLFATGETNGVFQFESSGIKRVLRQLQPDSFELVAAVNALYRPGPMENIDTFIRRKNGQEPVTYPADALAPILGPTYGVLVYQEQVMQVASVMGGFTLGQADLLRRAMSKRKSKRWTPCKNNLWRVPNNGAMSQRWPNGSLPILTGLQTMVLIAHTRLPIVS